MQVAEIVEIISETNQIKTFKLDLEVNATPGQFGMFWVPGIDEKPMSLSYTSGRIGITVLKLGVFTTRLHEMKLGDVLGVRAPLGRGFEVYGEEILIVGGGCGLAPLAPLAENVLAEDKKVTAIIGASTKGELLFVDRIKKAGADVVLSTEDGSAGIKGLVTDALSKILKGKSFDQCFTCGPELMMVEVLRQTKEKGIPTQISLQRYMKCGIGVCGQCVISDTGLRVCKDGPTFSAEEMERTSEFGKYWRNASGTKIYFGGE